MRHKSQFQLVLIALHCQNSVQVSIELENDFFKINHSEGNVKVHEMYRYTKEYKFVLSVLLSHFTLQTKRQFHQWNWEWITIFSVIYITLALFILSIMSYTSFKSTSVEDELTVSRGPKTKILGRLRPQGL